MCPPGTEGGREGREGGRERESAYLLNHLDGVLLLFLGNPKEGAHQRDIRRVERPVVKDRVDAVLFSERRGGREGGVVRKTVKESASLHPARRQTKDS